ncbi:MAG: hypothetical protein ACOH2A_13310 [Sphingobacteriaceae bacterium]
MIENKKARDLLSKDSTDSVIIDTLVMKGNSGISLYSKSAFKISINHAFIGKNCELYGSNGKISGRPLGQLRNSKVYVGNVGRNGITLIKKIGALAEN